MQDLDTALLRTFVTLAETASFSRTGGLIGRSQSAVSGQIRKLEDLLGCRLLTRDTRNVALTAEGERLLAPARQMLASSDAMLARFRSGTLKGEVRFGSPEDFASAYLPEVLGLFAQAHEGVQLHVSCKLTLTLIAEFEAGQQDLIILKQDPMARHAGARPLWQEPLVWVGPLATVGDFPDVQAQYAALGRALPLVLSPAPCVYRHRATRALDAAQVPWTSAFTSPSHAGCVAAVRAGLGFAVMPRGMVPDGVAVPGLEAGWPTLAGAEIALLFGARPSPATQALARFIEERVTRRRSDAA